MMSLTIGPRGDSEVRAYLITYAQALKRRKDPPVRPARFEAIRDLLDRYIRRLHEEVAEENRFRASRRIVKAVAHTDLGPDAIQVPGYTIQEKIGEGRFGTVFKAVDNADLRGQVVAVKIIKKPVSDSTISDELWEGIFGEAKKSKILKNVNVIKYIDHGIVSLTTGDRRAYIVWDYIEGQTLRQRVECDLKTHAVGRAGRWRWSNRWDAYQKQVARILIPVARAAQASHLGSPSHGVLGFLHCDINPSNILLDFGDEPYLGDFGLAMSKNSRGGRGGTRGFMAPEMSIPNSSLGPPVDIYSLGATLHYMLFGSPPTEVASVTAQPPARNRSLDSNLDAIRRKCLDPDPGRRFQSAAELADDLKNYAENRPVKARPIGLHWRLWKWAQRNPGGAFLVGTLASVVLASLIGLSVAVKVQNDLRARAFQLSGIALDGLSQVGEFFGDGNSRLSLELFPPSMRQQFVSQTLPSYDRIARLQGNDVRTLSAKARALVGRAKLRRLRGGADDDAGALADLDAAYKLYGQMPSSSDKEVGMATAAIGRTAILGPGRGFAAGITSLDHILPGLERVVDNEPGREDARFLLARGLSNRATCLRGEGLNAYIAKKLELTNDRFLRSEQDYDLAVRHIDFLAANRPDEPRYLEWASRIRSNLGLLLVNRAELASEINRAEPGRANGFGQAGETLNRAVSLAEALVSARPMDMTARDALLTAMINRGDAWLSSNHPTDAADAYRQAADAYDFLQSRFPEMREFAWGQAFIRLRIGQAIANQERSDSAHAALAVLSDAKSRYKNLVAKYPQVAEIAEEQKELLGLMEQLRTKLAP